MVKIQFFPLDIEYKVVNNKAQIHLFGRTTDNQQICVVDENFKPYFYVVTKKTDVVKEKLMKIRVEGDKGVSYVTKTEVVNKKFLNEEVDAIKVYTKLPRDVPVIRDVIKEWELIDSIYEYDIQFTRRYLIDKNIIPTTLIEFEGSKIKQNFRVPVFRADKIDSLGDESLKDLRVLAFDIETYNPDGKNMLPEKNPVLMVSFYGEDLKKVIAWKRFKTESKDIEFVDNEAELIKRFKEVIWTYQPDILTGYFSDGFDLPYMKTRADHNKIKLDMGLDFSEVKIKSGKADTAKITGIIHLDIFKFIVKVMRGSLDTDSYKLDAVANELLGEKKQEVNLDELAYVWDNKPEDIERFCDYNLQDSLLTYKLCKKMLPTILELVKVVSLPIYAVNRMGFSQMVEGYLLKQAQHFNEIAPNRPRYDELVKRKMQTYKGAFVFEPKPGLYNDIVIFDYRSLYPSIISSHNISPGTLNCDCCEGKAELTPGEDKEYNYWFCKRIKGFIPTIIGDLITRRVRIKEIIRKKEDKFLAARDQALKLLANSFYGYLGFFGARWYSIECARSVTAWGRFYIHSVIDKAKQNGFNVLYSDSLPFHRRVFVKTLQGDIRIMKIGELYNAKFNGSYKTLSYTKDNRVRFMPVKRVIRHPFWHKGKLLKITTKYGTTIVTNQHSIYTYNEGIKLTHAGKLKKNDHLISLTSPEIEVKYKEGFVFDIANLDLGNYKDHLRLYKDNLTFPSGRRGVCPYCGKSFYLATHVNLKHKERKQKITKESSFKFVGAINAKAGRIPRYWRLDKELAWILGFYCAEGSVSNVKTKGGRKMLLSFGSQDIKIIRKVKNILDKKIGADLNIIKNFDKRNKKNMYYYRIQRIPIISLFKKGFDAGKGSEFKKVPFFILNSEEKLRKAFIQGYLDGDGNSHKDRRYSTHFIRFSTKSNELAIGLDFLLKSIKCGTNFFGKEIKHVAWQYRDDKPKVQTLRLQSAKQSKGNFCLAQIRAIEGVSNEKYVYDLEVEGSHNFVDAEGMILVHNTDSVFLSLDKKTRKDAEKFLETINIGLPGLMELEYEGFYPSGVFVSAKEGPYGAKKKYALVTEQGLLKIKGFEAVRRNWSPISKEVQEKVLTIILKENNTEKALGYVKGIIGDLRKRKVPLGKLIIHTQLQKEISSYDAVGPHVAIARELKRKGTEIGIGSIIRYVVAPGKGRIRDRAKLPEDVKDGEYDSDYYINNQVIPAVERIFNVLGYKKEELLRTKEQKKLERFFG